MIITVTLNPAIDKTIELESLKIGGLNKPTKNLRDIGGKGINVSKVIRALGGNSLATGIAGDGGIEEYLNSLEIPNEFLRVNGMTRTNTKIFTRDNGITTEINEPGLYIEEALFESYLENLDKRVKCGDYIILSGSAPISLSRTVYADMIRRYKEKGINLMLDAEGELFSLAIIESPHIIKPNRHELELYFGERLDTDDAIIYSGMKFIEKGIERAFITLGSEGAIYCEANRAYRLESLPIKPHSSVGAGDAFVGAIAYGIENGYETEELLKLAVAASAGAVMTDGTKPMSREIIMDMMKNVVIRRIV